MDSVRIRALFGRVEDRGWRLVNDTNISSLHMLDPIRARHWLIDRCRWHLVQPAQHVSNDADSVCWPSAGALLFVGTLEPNRGTEGVSRSSAFRVFQLPREDHTWESVSGTLFGADQ